MGWLRDVFGSSGDPEPNRNPDDPALWGVESLTTASGERVTGDRALAVGAVFACVRVLAEGIAASPLRMFERTSEGRRSATDHELAPLFSFMPNEWQTAFEWLEMLVGHVALRGNHYSLIDFDGAGRITSLIPWNPTTTTVERLENRRLRYRHVWENGRETVHPQGEVLHVRGFGGDAGLVGLSRVALMRETLGNGLALEQYAGRVFSGRPMMGGVIEMPEDADLDDNSARRMARSFAAATTGRGGWHQVAILENGAKWKATGMSSEDAQWLEARRFTVEEVCRWFGVPPHLVALLDRATFSNIENQDLGLVKHTVRPWAVRIEQALTRSLIGDRLRYFPKFNLDAIARGDIESRYTAFAQAVQNGWMTRNEVRELEDRNPLPGLDEPLTPANMDRPGDRGADTGAAAARLATVVDAGAKRIARRELEALRRWVPRYAGDAAGFAEWVNDFTDKQARMVSESLAVSESAGQRYAVELARRLNSAGPDRLPFGPSAPSGAEASWEFIAIETVKAIAA